MLKNILLTGATGYLGRFLVETLLKRNDISLSILVRDKASFNLKISEQVELISKEELLAGRIDVSKYDFVIHAAFARTWGGKDLADSLVFTKQLTLKVVESGCSLLNISSRSVYGSESQNDVPWQESSSPNPETTYAIAKFASEELVSAIFAGYSQAYYTNIRLGSLAGFDFDQRIVSRFVDLVIQGQPIHVNAPSNKFSFLDVRDAADGIMTLLSVAPQYWSTIYNIGAEYSITLLELANMINIKAKDYGLSPVEIVIQEGEAQNFDLMSSEKIIADTNWKPLYNYVDIVDSIYKFKLNKNKS